MLELDDAIIDRALHVYHDHDGGPRDSMAAALAEVVQGWQSWIADAAADLRATVGDLEGYIRQRAEGVAEPRIADALTEAGDQIAAANIEVQRLADLVAELRAHLAARDRVIAGMRSREAPRVQP